MCGIVYVQRKDGKPAAKSVIKRFKEQRNRGTQGFGYVAIENDKVVKWERSANEQELLNKLRLETAPEILFHHRTPTSTPNVMESAHPLLIEAPKILDHQYFVVHNGVIRNSSELRKLHLEKGFEYQTEIAEQLVTRSGTIYNRKLEWNDTESLAIETALAMDDKKGFIGTEGSAAVIGLKIKDGKVVDRFYYRNVGNPLMYYEDNVMVTLTSQGKGALVDAVRVMRLKEGGGVEKTEPILIVPTTYKYTHNYHPRDTSVVPYSDYEDEDNFADMFHQNGQRKIGFLPPSDRNLLTEERTTHISEFLPQPDDEDETDDLSTWSLANLWGEFDRMLGVIEETEREIRVLDSIVNEAAKITDEEFAEKMELQAKLEEQQKYLDELEDEIDEKTADQKVMEF